MRTSMLALILFATACPPVDETPEAGEALTTEAANLACDEACDHQADCDWPDADDCVIGCRGAAGWMRGDAILAWRDCIVGLACSAEETACNTAVSGFGRLAWHDEYVAQCEAEATACGWGDEIGCGGEEIALLSHDLTNDLIACLALGCDDSSTCVLGVIETIDR